MLTPPPFRAGTSRYVRNRDPPGAVFQMYTRPELTPTGMLVVLTVTLTVSVSVVMVLMLPYLGDRVTQFTLVFGSHTCWSLPLFCRFKVSVVLCPLTRVAERADGLTCMFWADASAADSPACSRTSATHKTEDSAGPSGTQ